MTKSELNNSTLTVAVDASEPIRLVQITDCHLGEQPGEQLLGMDTDESLEYVLDLVRQEQPDAQLLLATGDLSNHGKIEAYRRLQTKLQQLPMPSAWLAGNHDSRELMVTAVGDAQLPRLICIGEWGIIMLDSAVPGKVGGELGATELERLRHLIEACDASHLLICLHHQPVDIGCRWLDAQQVADSGALFDILANEPRLRGILWGHVHQEFNGRDARLPGVKLMSTPSTCIQFAENQQEFKLDTSAPGYRWLHLFEDGRIETAVSRVHGHTFSVDYSSSGY